MRLSLIGVLLAGSLLILQGPGHAADIAKPDKLTLHYAGFAFAGDFTHSETAFPRTSALLSEKGGAPSLVTKELLHRIQAVTFDGIELTTDLGNTKQGDSIAIAFVLTWENLGQERVGQDTKLTADLRAEGLIFDFETKKVIAAFPFGAQVRDVVSGTPSGERITELFRGMYLGQQHNILDAFVGALKRTKIKRSYGAYAQITGVELEDRALADIARYNVNPKQLSDFIAGALEAQLFERTGVPLLPHALNHAVGGTMSARFANGEVYSLTLPVPDYRITMTVRGLKQVEAGATATEVAYAFANFSRLAVTQELRDKPYLNTELKFAVTKTVPRSVTTIDEWSAYQESLLALIDGVATQFVKPDDQWLKKWADGSARSQFDDAAKALERCR